MSDYINSYKDMEKILNPLSPIHTTTLFTLLYMRELMEFKKINKSKCTWERERLDWEEHIALKLHEDRFHIFYRMNLDTFNKLYSLLINHIDHDERKSRSKQPISNTLVIACGIRYLAGEKLRSIESEFCICKSMSYEIRSTFIEAVLQCPELAIKFPSNRAELESIAKGFVEKSSARIFTRCIGAIDSFLHLQKKLKLKMYVVIKRPFTVDTIACMVLTYRL